MALIKIETPEGRKIVQVETTSEFKTRLTRERIKRQAQEQRIVESRVKSSAIRRARSQGVTGVLTAKITRTSSGRISGADVFRLTATRQEQIAKFNVISGEADKKIVEKPVRLIVGKDGSRIVSGTILEPLFRKEVKPTIPTKLAKEGVKVFEQRIPLIGSILVSKKNVRLTQREYDKAQKFVKDTNRVLLRADRLDKVLDKAESKIRGVISKVPFLKGNSFVQSTAKSFISSALLYFNPITGIPILGARGSQLIDQAIQSGKLLVDKELKDIINKFEGDPNAFNDVVRKASKEAVKSVGESFDPTTPDGLANVLLVLTPLGFKALKPIKTSLVNVVSVTAKISKVSALKFVNSAIKSIGKLKGVNQFVKTNLYVRQLSKVKNAIRLANKNLVKLTREGKKIKKTTVKKLLEVKKEKLSLAKQKELDKLVLSDVRQLARKKLTSVEVVKLTNLNKVRVNILKKVDVLIKKSEALIKSRVKIKGKKDVKGVFVNKRILNNIKQRSKLDKFISRLELDLLNVIKKKESIFKKSKVTKEKVALGELEKLREGLRNDKILAEFIKSKIKTKRVKEVKRDIFIEQAVKDIARLDNIKKNFVKNLEKTIKANVKAIKAGMKVKISNKNVSLVNKINSEINRIKSFLKTRLRKIRTKKVKTVKRDVFVEQAMKDVKGFIFDVDKIGKSIKNAVNKVKRQVALSKIKRLKVKGEVEVKLRVGKKGKPRIKSRQLTIEFNKRISINKRILININELSRRVKSNVNSIKKNIARNVKTNISKLKQALRDEINIFKDTENVAKFIKNILNEEKNIKTALTQRKINLRRATKLKLKKGVLEGIVKDINNLKQDLSKVNDLIEINRRVQGLKSKTFIDVNNIINEMIKHSNTQRARGFRDLVKKKTGKPHTQQTNKVISNNKPAFTQRPISGDRLVSILEVENIKPVIDVLNPTQFGKGFNVGKAIAGISAIVKPKGVIRPQKPVIKPIPIVISSLLPKTGITPDIRRAVDRIIKSASIVDVIRIVSQQPKHAQKIIEKVVQRQKRILRQRKPVAKKPLLPFINFKRLKDSLRKGQRVAYNLLIEKKGRFTKLVVWLPKNRAKERIIKLVNADKIDKGEIFPVGVTRKKDITSLSLKKIVKKFRRKR